MDVGLRLAAVLAIIAIQAFFVAAEFALVSARRTRIEQLAARGNRAAIAVRRAMDDPTRYISACQVGITVSSLALGWIGEATIAELIEPALALIIPDQIVGLTVHMIAVPIAFLIITFLDISLGELVPKMIALQKAEATVLIAIRPNELIGVIFRPFIAVLYWFTGRVLSLFGMRWEAEASQAYTTEDLKMLIQSSRTAGALQPDPDRILERTLDFAQRSAHHIMVPRTEMVAVPAEVTLEQLAELMEHHQFSQYPVYKGSTDNIIGVLLAKRLAAALAERTPGNGSAPFDVRSYMIIPLFVPESMRAHKLLAEMKRARSHVAIVLDEYGVTAGLVTLRDILDMIAGEVRDVNEQAPSLVYEPDGSALVDGLMLLPDVEAEFGVRFDEEDYDTLGGLIFGKLGRRPAIGDRVEVAGLTLTVEEMDGLRVARVRVEPREGAVVVPSQAAQASG
ncbi:MAG: magnesium and cobalt exporter, family [Chloroflexota bacterium]|jgi:CBS domain containing-hemolysin-like protein|nr:magnesium and cobalt exporter, family [Chloroflexota bacterium]